MPDIIAGRQRIHVADQLIRFAHIAAHNADQGRVNRAAGREFHNRQIQSFLIDTGRISPKTAPADVHDMSGAGKETDVFALMKRRGDHRDVVQVAGAFPRVIGDIDVALKDVFTPDPADKMRDRIGHRIDVARGAGDGLCQHLSVKIVDPCRQVTCLAHRGGKSSSHQSLRLFFDDRDQPVPHDLVGDV